MSGTTTRRGLVTGLTRAPDGSALVTFYGGGTPIHVPPHLAEGLRAPGWCRLDLDDQGEAVAVVVGAGA